MDRAMQVLHGRGVASGVAMGRVVTMRSELSDIYRFPLDGDEEVAAEVERFEEARRRTGEGLRHLRTQVHGDLGHDLAAIFDTHLLLLDDASFGGRVLDRIRTEQVNAEWAVHKTVEDLEDRFAQIENEYLRERSEDLRDVARQLMRTLRGVSAHELSELGNEVIVVADDLTPSEAVQLGRQGVDGFVLEGGGRTSHTTIIARSLNVPLVAGVAGITARITDNDPLIVNGNRGEVVLHPTPAMLAHYRQEQQHQQEREQEMLATCALAACTRDGVEVSLMANIDLPEEVDEVVRFGAAGVGLYRSEFLYIERSPDLPTEDQHLAIYRRVLEAAAPFPAVIRTYDLGGRKLAREVMHTAEDNPVLGLRGIRLTLARPEVFRTQLRGLFRAGLHGELWVLLPMVSALEEVHRFRAFADEVMAELEAEGVPFARDYKLGVMIEVPGAALIADVLAREVDFFAIGTNDLIQYSLAVDRNNEHVADLYQPLHPAILRMVRMVLDAAAAARIDVELCGEMASDPRYAPVLVGLGLRRLSMSPRQVPRVKTRLRQMDHTALRRLADDCIALASASQVEQAVSDFFAGLAEGGSEEAVASPLRKAQ